MGIKFDVRSITVQLTVLILIVSLLPVIALTLVNYSSISALESDNFKDRAASVGKIGTISYSGEMNQNALLAQKFGKDSRIINSLETRDSAAIKKLADEYGRQYPGTAMFTIVDKSGITMARSASDKSGDQTTNKVILSALQGNELTSTEIINTDTVLYNNLQSRVQATGLSEAMAIVSAFPIKDEDGTTIGAAFVGDVLNNYPDTVDSVAIDANGICTIYQGDTRIATSLKDAGGNRIVGTKADPTIYSAILNGQSIDEQVTINNVPYYVYYTPVKDGSGKIIGMIGVGYDVSTYLATMNNILITSVGIGAIIALIAVVIGFIIVNRATRPINKLVAIADSVAAGSLDTQIETGATGGEIGMLTQSIRKMVGNIKERILFNESILKGITDPLFMVDTNSTITYVNEAGAKFFGANIHDMSNRKFGDFFTTLDSTSGESHLAKCLRTGEAGNGFETHIQLRTGRAVYVRGSNAPIKDVTGRITGAVELLQDVTRVKEAEEATKAAEQDAKEKAAFSDNILKSISDMHTVMDKAGKITYINEVALTTLGFGREEALGRNCDDVFGLEISLGRKMSGDSREVLQMENTITTKSGKKIPVATSIVVMKDASGNMTGFTGMLRDITREKAAKRQLEEITVSANKIAERVAMASGNVSTNVGQVLTSSRQISESIQQVAIGSQNQSRNIESISQLMHEMNSSISRVNEGARNTSENAVDANAEAKKGSENAKVAIQKMGELHSAVNDSARIVQNLGEKSKKIGQIVDMITAIAGQTNLLALNAAIEAARAGDAGRGFAVVAEEVRKLAEESARAAEEINQLIAEVREETARAVESMNRGTSEVDQSNRIVAASLKSLEDIGRMIDTTAAKAQEIAAMTEKQAGDTGKVVKAIEEMAAVIEENASSTEEVSASSEESTATAENVAEMANELAKIADELKAEVGKLKVE